MRARYATKTSVSVQRTAQEIEDLLSKYGAKAFTRGWGPNGAMIQFATNDRRLRFNLPLPDRNSRQFTHAKSGRGSYMKVRSQSDAQYAYEQVERQRWRALLLTIKAKLEAVAVGISTFESEFLSNIIDPVTGQTVGESVMPALIERYKGIDAPLLGLPAPERRTVDGEIVE